MPQSTKNKKNAPTFLDLEKRSSLPLGVSYRHIADYMLQTESADMLRQWFEVVMRCCRFDVDLYKEVVNRLAKYFEWKNDGEFYTPMMRDVVAAIDKNIVASTAMGVARDKVTVATTVVNPVF